MRGLLSLTKSLFFPDWRAIPTAFMALPVYAGMLWVMVHTAAPPRMIKTFTSRLAAMELSSSVTLAVISSGLPSPLRSSSPLYWGLPITFR